VLKVEVVEKITVEDVCPLFKFCRSPSKSDTWGCLKGGGVRAKSCVVYVAFMHGKEHIIAWLTPNGQK